MATYPAVSQTYATEKTPVSDAQIEYASDGTVRGQDMFSTNLYEFKIVHELITDAEKLSIESFYNSNKTDEFVFNNTADQLAYNLTFESKPIFKQDFYATWSVIANAIGTKA